MLVADVDGKSGQIAAGDLPLVVLLGEDCPDEPPDRSPVREDAHHVSLASDLFVEALLRVFDQICFQWATGKAVTARMSGPASASSSAACGKRSSSMPTIRACCA